MLIPINITGGSYTSRSLPLSAQVTRNFWPQIQDDQATKSPYVLHAWRGLKSFFTGSGADRGMFEHNGTLYKVSGTTLYSVNSAGVHTSLGTIVGSSRCIFDGVGSSIVITTGGKAYVWDGSALTEVTDSDLESPNSVTHINNQILYDGTGGRFASSDVGDATSISGLNYATAESNADDLIRVYAFNEQVYMFGNKSIERWWNSGVGSPPFDRIEGGIIPIGLAALHSVASNEKALYFLGVDNRVYAVQGGTPVVVSNKALSREFEGYSDVSDAIGWCFSIEGQGFYCLTFPTADKTFCFPEGGQWFELSSGVDGERFIGNSYARAHGKHLIADYRNGNIYEWDDETYDENGETVRRVRDSGPLHGGLLGAPGKRIEMNRFELIMETGVGLVSGQGSDPVVMLSWSDDGGKTFSTEQWGQIGELGQYQYKVEWFSLGSFESRILRVANTDPVFISIHSAAADIELGI